MRMRVIGGIALAMFGFTACSGQQVHAPDNPTTLTAPASAPPAAAAAAAAPLTPGDIRAMIEAKGASGAVQALWGTGAEGNQWDAVADRIAEGPQEWLDLVDIIAPGTDAGTAEGLKIAVSQALTKNAVGALKLVNAARPVDAICAMNVIEPSPEQIATYKAQATAAVAAVSDADLQGVKAACLKALSQIK